MATILSLLAAVAGSAVLAHTLERWQHAQLQMARLRCQRQYAQRRARRHPR